MFIQITFLVMRATTTLMLVLASLLSGETSVEAGTKWQGHCHSPLPGVEFNVSGRTLADLEAKCALMINLPVVEGASEVPCAISDQDCVGGVAAAVTACSVAAPLVFEGEAVRLEPGSTKRICATAKRPVTRSSCLMSQFDSEEFSWCIYDTGSRNGCAIGWVRSIRFISEEAGAGETVYCWEVRNESPFRHRFGRIYLD
jgi:hypothetical protein